MENPSGRSGGVAAGANGYWRRAARGFWIQGLALVLLSFGATGLFHELFPAWLNWPRGPDYSTFYEPVGRSLALGDGYRLPNGSPALEYPPGFPVLLAGVFTVSAWLGMPEGALISIMNAISVALGALALFAFARRHFRPAPAFLAASLFLTYPFVLYLTRMPSTEVVFIGPLYAALCLMGTLVLRASRSAWGYCAVGALLGAAMLIRPIGLGVGLLAPALVWAALSFPARLRGRLAAMVLLGNLIVVLPWEVWLYRTTGRIIPLSTNGLPSAINGLTFALDTAGREPIALPDDVIKVMANIRAHRRELHSMGDLAARLSGEFRSAPAAVLKLVAIKALRTWYGSDSRRLESLSAGLQAVYLLLVLGCSGFAIHYGGPARRLAIGVWIITGYFWLMTLAVLPLLRYMVPGMGLLFLTVAAAAASLQSQRRLACASV